MFAEYPLEHTQLNAAGHIPHLLNALHTEALAAEFAVEIAQQHCMGLVCLETDSLIPKNALEDRNVDLSSVGPIIDRIKVFARCNFSEFRVRFVPRICNQVAHTIAAKGAHMIGQAALVTDGVDLCVSVLVASNSASRTV